LGLLKINVIAKVFTSAVWVAVYAEVVWAEV